MKAHGFRLDLKQRTLGVGTEELILHQQEDICAQMVLTEDVILPERSELLVTAQVEGSFGEGVVAMLDPRNEDLLVGRGILIAKTLIVLDQQAPTRQSGPFIIDNISWP